MSKEAKEAISLFGKVIICAFLLIGVGFVIGDTYRLHHQKTVDTQHEELMLEGEYKYCPYCGEELER